MARRASPLDVRRPTAAQTRAPLIQATGADFGAGVGEGLQAAGAAAADTGLRLQAAEKRITDRRESIERIRDGRSLHEFANRTFTQFSGERDFSKLEDAEEFGQLLTGQAQQITENHRGGEDSRLRLQERLEPILQMWSDRAGTEMVKAQEAIVMRETGDIINTLSSRARQGEDPRLLIAEGLAHLDSEKDSYRSGQEIAFKNTLRARVWGAKVDDFLAKAEYDEAEDLITLPEVSAIIGQDGQKKAFDRIAAARRQGTARILTPGETTGLGFPEGTIVQKKRDGSFDIVLRPEKDETIRTKKIEDLTGRGIEQARAQDIVDGNIRVEIVPQTGEAREVNEVTGEVKVVQLGGTNDAPQQPQQRRTLFDLANSGAIAGVVPATQEFLGRTLGQIPGVPVATDVTQARQEVRVAQNELIRALSINPRFPVGEINRIREEIKIEPSLFDSQRSLLSRMKGIDGALRTRLANEEAAAKDVNLPQDTRSSAAQAAQNIGNFLDLLGIPEGFDPKSGVPEGLPDFSNKIGVTRDGKDVWQSPDGKRWVVE